MDKKKQAKKNALTLIILIFVIGPITFFYTQLLRQITANYPQIDNVISQVIITILLSAILWLIYKLVIRKSSTNKKQNN